MSIRIKPVNLNEQSPEFIPAPSKELTKKFLKKEMASQKLEDYTVNEINWLEDEFWDSWDKLKGHSKILWEHKTDYAYSQDPVKWFFLAHFKNIITGKPQLVENVQRRIPLVRQAIKRVKKNKEEFDMQSFYFLDEKFDKRHDGFQKDAFALDFWIYKIITEEGIEFYILTQQKLPNCTCEFKGMEVQFDDFAEMSRSMRLKSLSRFFFLKEFTPTIKILSPEDLVKYTKERKIKEQDWLDLLAYHPLGTQNRFPKDIELLKSAWLLSGEVDDYPLHLGVFGRQGTRKSKGYIETTAFKFDEHFPIIEGGNSRLKGLIPSFKEKPANLGYLAKQERVGFVDELSKMIEERIDRDNQSSCNILGEANFLLDHSRRLVGSGNDNDVEVQATGKFMFVMNPVRNCPTIYSHVGILDSTFMSRILWWVQDEEEQKFVLSSKGIVRFSDHTNTSYIHKENRKKDTLLSKCWRKVSKKDEFITLFDSCNNFLVNISQEHIERLSNVTIQLAKDPMKSVWKPRAEHHITLLLDGVVKHRCLFQDYDMTFKPKKQDYEIVERILVRMINSWDTDLSVRQECEV